MDTYNSVYLGGCIINKQRNKRVTQRFKSGVDHNVVAIKFEAMLVINHHFLHAEQTADEDLIYQTKTLVHLTQTDRHTHRQTNW